jgi:tetratricopeptide (TPR) repeat protein
MLRKFWSLSMFSKFFSFFNRSDVDEEIRVSNVEEHNAIYKKGVELIRPQMILDNSYPKQSKEGSKNVRKGINFLKAVTAFNPSNWNAYWIMGKGYQALGEHREAYKNFKKAYEIKDSNPNVARELGDSCMRLGYGPEAVTICIAAIEADPKDAGLHANLALGYLISGENSFAQRAILYALEMNPEDQISKNVLRLITEVINGKRAQPKTSSDF